MKRHTWHNQWLCFSQCIGQVILEIMYVYYTKMHAQEQRIADRFNSTLKTTSLDDTWLQMSCLMYMISDAWCKSIVANTLMMWTLWYHQSMLLCPPMLCNALVIYASRYMHCCYMHLVIYALVICNAVVVCNTLELFKALVLLMQCCCGMQYSCVIQYTRVIQSSRIMQCTRVYSRLSHYAMLSWYSRLSCYSRLSHYATLSCYAVRLRSVWDASFL